MSSPSTPAAGSSSSAGSSQLLKSPDLSLAKGGGSLKGAEEKFQANPVTGSAGVTISLPTSPGREGGTPALSLGYDSGSGAGPFGLGWSLSLPSISRQTSKRLPLYEDTTESDVFVMASAEDLIPLEDLGTIDGYQVRGYRPRIEGGFSRIERWTDDGGVCHWRVFAPDSSMTIFGADPESRIFDPDFPRRIFRWLPNRTTDAMGNVVVFRYRGDGAQRLLDSVLYGNSSPSTSSQDAADFHFRLAFAYEERPDPYTDRRAGFVIKTSLRCTSIHMEHRFTELGPDPLTVHSLVFSYQQSDSGITLLSSATRSGHKVLAGGSLETKSLPALSFEYQAHAWNTSWQDLPATSIDDVVGGISSAHWLDLWGEGLPGLLSERGNAWWYKRNLGGGGFTPAQAVSPKPRPSKASGLLDLEGDGHLWQVEHTGSAGSVRLTEDAEWSTKKAFRTAPKVDFTSPRLRFLDLDGDGRAEVVIDEGDHLTWYPSEGEEGYGAPRQRNKAMDGEKVQLVARGKHEAIFLADMSGDGLADVVRVSNSEVCYWPSLGHGRFGEKIVMSNSPWITEAEVFDPQLVRLADVDGTGLSDLLYMDSNRVRVWLNWSGEHFGSTRTFPLPENVNVRVEAADVLGTGTACLVWSSSLPEHAQRPARYLNLMSGKKPHVMSVYRNNMGKEVRLEYTASTVYYLADRAAGTPWASRLPYVVQCLSRVETTDLVTGWKHASLYSYHHGCYDGYEREFRGFGRVDRVDSENGTDAATDQSPVLTRTWFHLGVAPDGKWLPTVFASEYWKSADAETIAPSLIEPQLPTGLTPRQWKEAHRAFKGHVLREEVYGLDGSSAASVPYTTTDHSYKIDLLSNGIVEGDRYHPCTVWLVTESENIARHYERDASDPRVGHSLVLSKDGYGRPLLSASIVYARSVASASSLADVPASAQVEQQKRHVTITEAVYAQDFVPATTSTQRAWRMGPSCRTATWELTGATAAGAFFTLSELSAAVASSSEIGFEVAPTTGIQKRLVECVERLFWNDALSDARTDGTAGLLGLVHQSYSLAYTPNLLDDLFTAGRISTAMLSEGGYAQRADGNWWVPSGKHVYAANASSHFYQSSGIIDPFGHQSSIIHDSHDLLVTSVTDALGNTITAQNDYRTLSPVLVTDPNDNRTAIETDALGIVVKSAVMGKEGAGEGDTLSDPTSMMSYSLTDFSNFGTPNWIRTRSRERHADPTTPWLERVEYSDGLGNVSMTKSQAEPGVAKVWDSVTGTVQEVDTGTALRWVGTGRKILNNKGNPVKQYEPYFSPTDDYESEAALVETGVTPVLHYDPLDRMIRTDFPDGTFSKVEFTAWKQISFDQNDTVLESEWYQDRGSPDPNAGEPSAPETRAAWLAARQATTPTTAHLDSLGRAVVSIAQIDATSFQTTHSTLDLEGNLLRQTVSRDAVSTALTVLTQTFDILGRVCMARNPDSGAKLVFADVASATLRSWDQPDTSNERSQAFTYDALRRPLTRSITASGSTYVAEVTTYGESLSDAKARNLRGQPHVHKDGAGIATDNQRDFHGKVTESVRQLTVDTKSIPDWSQTVAVDETFTTKTAYDALGRVVRIDTPHNSTTVASSVYPVYNEANLLNQVDVKLRGSATATTFVSNIDYDAKGQRQRIQYGNGSTTRYDHDPLTYRLTRLLTTRNSGTDILQDLSYTYDPSGNVVQITDAAQQTIFFNNQVVSPTALYEYDALYRLTKATGREHVNNGAGTEPETEGFNPAQPLKDDGAALRNYTRQWSYDQVGNILSLIHTANGGSWSRAYAYATDSNRLASTTVGSVTQTYTHNTYGSLQNLPHLDGLTWTADEHLHTVTRGTSQTWYTYDSAGQRVRKYTEKSGLTEERLYLGGFEIYRKRQGGNVTLERETLHIMDGVRRIALVEIRTVGTDSSLPQTIRYQLDNHLQSATLELDDSAQVISYEEYYPYGDTSYQSGRDATEVQHKRYRYTGKEKDEESGLYYHGARYFAAWLGRWTAADPSGMVDGPNLYAYVRNHPIGFVDPSGNAGVKFTVQQNSPTDKTSVYLPTKAELDYASLPSYNAGSNSPAEFGKPYATYEEATSNLRIMKPVLLFGISKSVDSRVVPLWERYLEGGVSTPIDLKQFNPEFESAFQNDAVTQGAMDLIHSQTVEFLKNNPNILRAGKTNALDLKAIIPATMKEFGDYKSLNRLNFDAISSVPGNVVGDFGPPGDQNNNPFGRIPSKQDDAREVSGSVSISLRRGNRNQPELHFDYSVDFKVYDTMDLLPGNYGQKRETQSSGVLEKWLRPAEEDATVPMSRLEASGLVGDVPVRIEYNVKKHQVLK